MTVLGITGGSGCGKTTALQAVRDLGGLVLDCDEIYHWLLQQDKALPDAIEARFPGVVSGGVLDRKALGRLVFSDPQALQDLNCLTHAAVCREVRRRLRSWSGSLAAIDAIALFESGLAQLCRFTIAVTAPREERILRLMNREGISRGYALRRIAAQPEDAYFIRLCDFKLENSGSREDFYSCALALVRRLAGLAP